MQRFKSLSGLVLAVFIVAAACGFQKETDHADKNQGAAPRLIYQCEDGGTFLVEFAPRGESVLVILPGKRLHLPAVPAASGARYSDGQNTFWTKGDEAILELDGKIRYRGCRRQQE